MKKILMFISSIVVMLLLTIPINAQASQQFMNEDDARYFLSFIYNCNYEYDDIKNDQYFKMLTGKLEDEANADEIKLSFLTTMQVQINNNIDKSAYNCDILRSDLQSYLEEKASGMKDLPEQEYNAFLNKQLGVVEDALVDWLCSVTATKAGIYVTENILDNIKLASSCYSDLVGAPQKAIEYADYVINGVKAAMLPINEELTGRYSYFSVYLTNRKAYSDDTTFDIIMDYNKLEITQNYPFGTIDWYIGSKDSWIEHTDDIERWADITIQIENSIEGVNGSSSSEGTSDPTPDNTTITFTRDTYIADTSDYIGYVWDLNGHTVVVDRDLNFNKNININGGALVVAGNMTYGGAMLNISDGYLIVDGNLTQTGGTMNVGSGILKVGGNYYAKKGTFDAGSGRTEIGGSFLAENFQPNSYSVINFYMQNEKAYMLVDGDFVIYIAVGEDIDISAGTLELKGDFTEKNGSFPATGTHKVILSGTDEQVISFGLPSKSCFNILEIQNQTTPINFASEVHFNKVVGNINFGNGTLKLIGSAPTFECDEIKGKNLYVYTEINCPTDFKIELSGNLTVNNSIVLGNGTINVAGNLTQNDGTLDIGSGTLKVFGDYYAKKGTFDAGSGRTEIGGSFLAENFQPNSYSVINFYMQNEKAYMLIDGDFVIYIAVGEDIDISAGTLELKGDFTEKNGSFPATGTHKVILSGTDEQVISFGLPSKSYFNILEIQNPNVTWKSAKKYSRLIISTPLFFDNILHSNSNNTLSVSVWTSQELQERNGIVILAVYDADSMIDIYYQNVSETVSHAFVKLPIVENGYIVKAFCWSDLETLVPLCNSISTTVQ